MIGTYLQAVKYLAEQNALKPSAKWEIKEAKERRSLDSNAYFHVLADKLRQKMSPPWSMAHIKNHLITSYGQPEYEDGQMVYIKANIPEERMQEYETLHCLPVKYESDATFYRVYRGSHTYDTKEMSQLIAGTVDECQAVGIQTATPEMLKQMQVAWEIKYGRKMENN
jgi:hypothetical protein